MALLVIFTYVASTPLWANSLPTGLLPRTSRQFPARATYGAQRQGIEELRATGHLGPPNAGRPVP